MSPTEISPPAPRYHTNPLLLAAIILLAIHFVLALTLIPPWQQPDEATHVALAEFGRSRLAGLTTPDPAREAEILQSMARHDWWQHRAWLVPVPTPDRFGQPAAGNRVVVEVTGITDPPAYFTMVSRILSWLPRLSIDEDLYVLRGISAALGMLTLLVAWFAAREFTDPSTAAIVTLLLAVHPQFAIVSTAASPDALTNLLAACMWWQAGALVRTQSAVRLLFVWANAIAAAASDRMGLPLVAVAAVGSAGVLSERFSGSSKKTGLKLVTIFVLMALTLAAMAGVIEVFGATYGVRRVFSAIAPVEGAMTWDRFIQFNWQLHRSWWYAVGWGRYISPWWWSLAATAITLTAALGLGRRFSTRRGFTPLSPATTALALAGIGIQLLAVYWTYFRLGNGAQGRYLFPMLVPALILLWAGVEAWVPRQLRWHAAGALVLLVAVLDIAAWILVAVPAYYASL